MGQLLQELDKIVNLAIGYYKDTLEKHKKFTRTLAKYVPELDVMTLQMNKNTRSLYFDESAPKCIGVLCYYTDEHGKVLTTDDIK